MTSPAAQVAGVLALACLALLLTAPTNGDFWPQDAPRHALNGVFVKDLVANHPFSHPWQWAIDYYLRRPALTILFYPPVFYAVEAVAYAVFGVSHFVAQATVAAFAFLLAVAVYAQARSFLPRWSAVGSALLAISMPEVAFWGRQVMLDIPAYALIVASAACLVWYLRTNRTRAIYFTALLLVAGVYTKYNAGFVALALTATFFAARGRRAFSDRHGLAAAALTAVAIVPAALFSLKFGAQNLASVTGLTGALPLTDPNAWLYYISGLPAQVGIVPLTLATCGLVTIGYRCVREENSWTYVLLLAWLISGYLFYTAISLRIGRNAIMVLLPLAIAAPLFLTAILPRRLGEASGLVLGVGALIYTLVFCPVTRIEGYAEIATYLAHNVPPNGVVLYAGYRDANLIFDLATIRDRPDIVVIRIDKLLLSVPAGERRRGIRQKNDDATTISRMLRDLGASYFVVQPDFWSDIAVMANFNAVMTGPEYRIIQHFDLAGDLSTQDGTRGIDVLRPTYEIAGHSGQISMDMPLAGEKFQGPIH